jgi:hypothetical protein
MYLPSALLLTAVVKLSFHRYDKNKIFPLLLLSKKEGTKVEGQVLLLVLSSFFPSSCYPFLSSAW